MDASNPDIHGRSPMDEASGDLIAFTRSDSGLQSPAGYAGSAFLGNLAVLLVPVMIVILFGALQQHNIFQLTAWSLPLTLLVATGWTAFELRTTMVRLEIIPGAARFLSLWDQLYPGRTRVEWEPIVELRRTGDTLFVTLQDASIELRDEEWPEIEAIIKALQKARDARHPA